MTNNRVRSIFIFFLIWLPVQYGLVGVTGYYKSEPWPAFVFPGFKNVYIQNGAFTVDHTFFEIHTDLETFRVRVGELFSEIPTSQRTGFMRTNFWDEEKINSLSDNSLRFLKSKIERETGLVPHKATVIRERKFYSLETAMDKPDSSHYVLKQDIYFKQDR